MMPVMSFGWFLVVLIAGIGAIVAWRGSRIAGGALVVGAVVAALGLADVSASLPSRDKPAAAASEKSQPAWVLRVTLTVEVGRLPDALTGRWAQLPGVGTARPDGKGAILLRGEPDSNVVERRAVEAALSGNRFVTSVEVVD
jgi:hypothetical protein